MWWIDVQTIAQRIVGEETRIHATAMVEPGAVLDDSAGPIIVGARTKICAGAIVRGPIQIGADCMVGELTPSWRPFVLGSQVCIGFATEIKQAQLKNRVRIGPMCFVAEFDDR